MFKRFHWRSITGITVAIALTLGSTGMASALPTHFDKTHYPSTELNEAQNTLKINSLGTPSNEKHLSNEQSQELPRDAHIEDTTVVEVEQIDGEATVVLQENGFITVDVSANIDDTTHRDSLDVVSLTILDDETGDFIAELRSEINGKIIKIDTTKAEAQAFPVLVVLGAVARIGIKVAIKQYTKSQIKKAAKSYLLNSLNSNGWRHIMHAKHNWSLVGAKSREQIAEIISNAMANGTHRVSGYHVEVTYRYLNRQIVVRYAKNGGKISDAWVVR